jgi:hypothetical protein
MNRELRNEMVRKGVHLEVGELQQRIDALRELLKANDVDSYTPKAKAKGGMTAAARKAVSLRMKAYWRKRKAGKA